jgi:hypothetical protein
MKMTNCLIVLNQSSTIRDFFAVDLDAEAAGLTNKYGIRVDRDGNGLITDADFNRLFQDKLAADMRTAAAPAPKGKRPTMSPQCEKVLKLLKSGPVTGAEASTVFKIRHLPRRIADLKALGYDISRKMKKDAAAQRYASYTLVGE